MGGAGSNRPAPRLCQFSRDPWRQLLDARRPPWLSPGVKKPGPGPHADAPDVTSGARRHTAAMKWQRHEDGDIILAVVIICALAGLAWPGWPGGGGAGFWSGPLTRHTPWAFSEDARSAWGAGPAGTWRTMGACGTSWKCTRRR